MVLRMKIEFQFFNSVASYLCASNSASIYLRFTEIESIKGEHLPGKNNDDVELVKFFNTRVDFIPRGLQEIFKNMNQLWITNCRFKEISQKDLIGLENLQTLCLDNNELTSIPTDLFLNMLKLKCVSFSNNRIEFLSSELFIPLLDKLELVNLLGNTKINAFYNSGVVGSISLQELMSIIDANCNKPIYNQNEYLDTMIEGFEGLWRTKRLSDFKIIVEQKVFPVHKVVLASRSSVFLAMFDNEMHERQTNQVIIPDFSADAFEEFLKFLYTARIPDECNAMELFAIASKYDVSQLKKICQEYVLKNLNESNALDVLNLGNLYCSEEMIQNAFNAIVKKYPDISFPDHSKNSPNIVKEALEKMYE